MLESFAYHLVQSQQVGCRDTFSVWWVSDDDTLLLRLGKVLEILQGNGHLLAKTSSLHVASGYLHRLAVVVVSIDMVLKLPLSAIVLVYALKEFAIEVGPFLKGILLAEHSGGNATCYERCLHGKSAATAHWVNKVALTSPACLQDYTCCKNFVQRSLHCLLAVAAAVQTFARTVQCQGAVVFCHMDVQLDIGVHYADIGAVACFFTELVHDGILNLVCHKLGMLEFVAEHHAVHGKGCVIAQVLRPVNLLYSIVHLICSLCLEMAYGLQYSYGCAQLEIGTIHHLLITRKGHHAASYLNVVGTEVNQFRCQHCLQALEGLGN